MNKLVILIFLGIIISLLSGPSLVNAEIKMTPPSNWQPAPANNSTTMAWFQNSTKSLFGIIKPQNIPSFPLIFVGPIMSQFFADKGALDSVDQTSFGRSNYGYRYILNFPPNSELLKSSNSSQGQGASILSMFPEGDDVPYKGMVIITEKQSELYAILLFSPIENFDSVMKEIQPTIDSIQLSNSTTTIN